MNTFKSLSETPQDWHSAKVVCELRLKGWSLRKLSTHHGYSPNALSTVHHRPWPLGQSIIAETLGVEASVIWPSRYDPDKVETRGRKTAITKLPRHLAAQVNSRLKHGGSVTDIYQWLSKFDDNNMTKSALASHAKRCKEQS